MSFFGALEREAALAHTLWVTILVVLATAVARTGTGQRRARQKPIYFLFIIHLLSLVITAAQSSLGDGSDITFRMPAQVAGSVAMVGCVAVVLFDLLLPKLHLSTPGILQDVMVAIASVIAGVTVASRAGVNLSGLIATSAVFTAVLGFSLQDVIGNIAGGLALQVDNSISIGDWVKVNDVTGKVTEIRWRYSALETRNWETVLIPNSQLMKSAVQVLGRRTGKPQVWRRWITFNCDWRYQPTDVIACVEQAVRNAKVDKVAVDPAPNCVLTEMGDSFGRYGLRYWLTDLAATDGTDSEIRTVIYFALQRAGMKLSMPAHAIFLTEESADRAAIKTQQQIDRRARLLGELELFQSLSLEERTELAKGLKYTPFAHGEVMTRQGADAHWLYILEEGKASVRVSDKGLEKEVATIEGPAFFGEMSLMTGEPRSATVVAQTDTECFRLDQATFKSVITQRPEIAESIARVLTKRRAELLAAREGLDAEASMRRLAGTEKDLLHRIRDFFALGA